MTKTFAARPSAETIDYYRKLFQENGVSLENEGEHGGKSADRIVLVHTQGFMPTKAGDFSLARDPRYPEANEDTGGQTMYVLGLAKALAEQGRKVTILAQRFGEEVPAYVKWNERVEIVRIPPEGIENADSKFPLTRKVHLYPKARNMAADAVAVSQLVGAQAVIGHYADGGMVGLELAEQFKIPMIFTAHSLGLEKMKRERHIDHGRPADYHTDNLWFAHRTPVEMGVIRGANHIVSNSPEETRSFEHLYRLTVNEKKQEYMPAGVSEYYLNLQNAPSNPDVLTKGEFAQHNLKSGEFFISWQRISETKNLEGQVKIFAELKRRFSQTYQNFKLVMIGWSAGEINEEERAIGEQIDRLEEEYINEGVLRKGDVVRITGKSHSEIAPIAKEAIAYLGTQAFEPFGMAAAENMALKGGVTIVPEKAGIAKWMKHNVNGIKIDPSNIEDAAKKIHFVVGSAKEREMFKLIRDNAAKIANRHFTWDGIAKRETEILDELMDSTVEGRGFHRSLPVWFGREAVVSKDHMEAVEKLTSQSLLDWLSDMIKGEARERIIISTVGEKASGVADFISTTLFTEGINSTRVAGKVMSEATKDDLLKIKDINNHRYAIGDAAIPLRDVDVVVTDVVQDITTAQDLRVSGADVLISVDSHGVNNVNFAINGASMAMQIPLYQPAVAIR